MKLIRTHNDTGFEDGYYDPVSGCHYCVRSFCNGTPYPFQVVVESNGGHRGISLVYSDKDNALAELDRIAALIEGKAPTQGWVAGAPPLVDGEWFLAMHQGEPVAVHCHAPNDLPWTDSAGNDYPSSEFTHHLPTPIQPPKES